MMRIGMICVCHNTHEKFDEYYSSIKQAASNFDVDIILLDNSITVPEVQHLRYQNLSDTDANFFYKRVENLGYLSSAQRFLQTSVDNPLQYDFICISNVDLKLDHAFFARLEFVASDLPENAGMIAPKIITADNINKNPKIITRPKRRYFWVRKLLFSSFITHFLLEKVHLLRKRTLTRRYEKKEFKNLEKIYAAHGSFFLFSRPAYDAVIHTNYPVFLFGEEIFLAELMRKSRLVTCYKDDLIIYDSEHASTSKMKNSRYRQHNLEALNFILKSF